MSTRQEQTEWIYKMKELMSPDLAKLANRMDSLEKKMLHMESTSSKTFQKMGADVKGFSAANNKMVGGLTSQMPQLQQMMGMLSNPYVIAGAAIAGTAVIMKKSIDVAEEYNSQFLELKNLNLDKTTAQIGDLNDMILNLSFEKGLDPTKTAKAFFDIQSATGKYGKEVEVIVGRIGQFSQATKADMDTMTGAVAKAMGTYQFGADQIDKFLESNAKTVQMGVTTFNQLAAVQTVYGSAAAGAGQGFDTANKFFAGFTKISKSVDIASELTKTAFMGLSDPKVQEGLKGYGVNVFDATGKMKDATLIVEDLNTKIKLMSDQQFAGFMGKVGGPEGMKALLQTIKSQGDGLLETFHGFDKVEFSVDKALANANGDLTVMKSILNNTIKTVMTEIGQVLIPPIVRGISMAVTWIKDMKAQFMGVSQQGSNIMSILTSVWNVIKVVFQIATFWSRIFIQIGMKIGQIASKSELVKNIAHGIGEAFKMVGQIIDWLIDKVTWLVDNTIGPMLERLDSIYRLINGSSKTPATSNSVMDMSVDYLKSKGVDPQQFLAQNQDQKVKLMGMLKAGKLDESKALIDSLINKSLTPKEGLNSTTETGNLGGSISSSVGKDAAAIASGGKSVKHITVTINKLVETINNVVSSIKEGGMASEDIIVEALTKAVRDAEITLGQD